MKMRVKDNQFLTEKKCLWPKYVMPLYINPTHEQTSLSHLCHQMEWSHKNHYIVRRYFITDSMSICYKRHR